MRTAAPYDLIMEAGGKHEAPMPQAPDIQPNKGLLSSSSVRWGVVLALGSLFIGNRPETPPPPVSSPSPLLSASADTDPSPRDIQAHIDLIAARCTACCTASDLFVFSGLPRDRLTGADLSRAATQVSPSVRSEMHRLAEILSVKPEYAPYALQALKASLGDLDVTDPRKYACLFMEDGMRLGDDDTVQGAASDFLREERECGMYRPHITTTEITALGKH